MGRYYGLLLSDGSVLVKALGVHEPFRYEGVRPVRYLGACHGFLEEAETYFMKRAYCD